MNMRFTYYTKEQQLELFHTHELQNGVDMPPARRVFILRGSDGALIPLDSTLVEMFGDEE